jgi:hypothetical protein
MRLLAQFVLVVASLALLTTAAHAQAIDACVMNNGILKVLDEGAECLPQEKPITLGQPQPAVETVRVFDGNGRDIGAFVGSAGPHELLVMLRGTGMRMRISSSTGMPNGGLGGLGGSVLYELLDCQGEAYVQAYFSNMLILTPGSLVVGATHGFKETFEFQSMRRGGYFCDNGPFYPSTAPGVVPVEAYTGDLGVTFPLPPPLWIGSSIESP